MELTEFINLIPNFCTMRHVDRVPHLGWYLHVHRGMPQFATGDIRQCYETLHLETPNVADVLASLAAKKPKVMLRSGKLYRLEMQVRRNLDTKYLNRPVAIPIDKMLEELPGKVPDEAERKYLTEAIKCFRAEAFRGAIIMSWNLAYDHLVNWLLADAGRLATFNSHLPNKEPFRSGFIIAKRADFEELKESETVSICAKMNLITDNQKSVLEEKLKRRNMYAHPNTLEVSLYRVGDHICDLVNHVILQLT